MMSLQSVSVGWGVGLVKLSGDPVGSSLSCSASQDQLGIRGAPRPCFPPLLLPEV